MKINFDQPIIDLRTGEPMPEKDGADQAANLRFVAMNALLQSHPEDAQTPGRAYELYTLAHRIKDGGEVELSAEDAALIKARVEKFYAPMIVGQAWDMLDQRDAPVG